MTKRDSSRAELASPRDLRFHSWSQPMSAYLRRHPSGTASSSAAAASTRHGLLLPGSSSASGSHPETTFGYAASAPSLPMPNLNPTWQQPEYYPLQEQLSQDHRVFYTQIFKEVTSGHGANRVRRLMVTEIDRTGQERNRRPEFFFNGILGHVRDRWEGYIDSWTESSRLANYWRRFFNIDEIHEETNTERHQAVHHQNESDDAAPGDAEDLADDTSVTVHTGDVPATILYNVLIADPEYNAPILEKLQIPPGDPSGTQVKLVTEVELLHMASHLAITATELARNARPDDYEDISDISDYIMYLS